jgi:hypothetical protein
VHFRNIYAPGTRQNHPNKPGLFRIWLARGFDTRPFPDGDYRLMWRLQTFAGMAPAVTSQQLRLGERGPLLATRNCGGT